SPIRAASHSSHRQFHCGNPPPAAEPRTRTITSSGERDVASGCRRRPRQLPVLPVVEVGSDLGTEVDELKLRPNPRHTRPPSRVLVVLWTIFTGRFMSLVNGPKRCKS